MTDGSRPVVEAAGGLLWRETAQERELAVIHRPYRADWTLPKGKREPGEDWQTTALREVEEETGCRAQLESYAGALGYNLPGGAPKVVLYWNMLLVGADTFAPNDEVDILEWLPPLAALLRIQHDDERALLLDVLLMGQIPLGNLTREGILEHLLANRLPPQVVVRMMQAFTGQED